MNVVIPVIQWAAIGPELILSITAMLLLLITVLAKEESKRLAPYLSLAGVWRPLPSRRPSGAGRNMRFNG